MKERTIALADLVLCCRAADIIKVGRVIQEEIQNGVGIGLQFAELLLSDV